MRLRTHNEGTSLLKDNVSNLSQIIEPPNDSNGSILYAIKLILGCTSLEMRIILHMRPNLGHIQSQSVFWCEVLSRSVDDPQLLWGRLGLAFQMIAILAIARNVKTPCADTGCGCNRSVLVDW